MDTLYCACCGRPFQRAHQRGPAPLYCSADCRRQMDVRRRVWAAFPAATLDPRRDDGGYRRAASPGW